MIENLDDIGMQMTRSNDIKSYQSMGDHWKNHFNTNVIQFPESPLRQVDRTLNGSEEDPYQTGLTVDAVTRGLDLLEGDRILDIGCGNGLITDIIARRVSSVIGVDFSERLIEYAKAHKISSNIMYYVGDASKLHASWYQAVNKACMLGGLQYLDGNGFAKMLAALAAAPQLERIFISAIPDASKIGCYYDNPEKMAYHLERQAAGQPHMGNWWDGSYIETLAREAGFTAECAPQDARFMSSYYRFDCVLKRNFDGFDP